MKIVDMHEVSPLATLHASPSHEATKKNINYSCTLIHKKEIKIIGRFDVKICVSTSLESIKTKF
jgi:hypothetical protein